MKEAETVGGAGGEWGQKGVSEGLYSHPGFPHGSDGKASACTAEDSGCIPGSGRCRGEGNDNPLQYSCLENPMDRGGYSPWGHKELGHD